MTKNLLDKQQRLQKIGAINRHYKNNEALDMKK